MLNSLEDLFLIIKDNIPNYYYYKIRHLRQNGQYLLKVYQYETYNGPLIVAMDHTNYNDKIGDFRVSFYKDVKY